MAIVDDQLLCMRTQTTLDQISDGLYGNVEDGTNTYNLTRVVRAASKETLTQVSNITKTRPGDLSCTDVKADVKILVPDCADITCSDIVMDCTPLTAAKSEYVYDRFSVNDSVCGGFTMDASLFDCSCDDPFETLAHKLKSELRKMKASMNLKLGAKLLASVGVDSNGVDTSVTPVPMKIFVEDALGRALPQPAGYQRIMHEFDQQSPSRSVDPVTVTSSTKFKYYANSERIWTGNVDGFDANRGSMDNVFYDPAIGSLGIDPLVAAEPSISWLPGSNALIEYYDYGNPEQAIKGSSFFDGMVSTGRLVRTIMDIGSKVEGVPFLVDAMIYFDDCENTVTYKFNKIFDLYSVPQDAMCGAFNFRVLGDVQCSPFGCADMA